MLVSFLILVSIAECEVFARKNEYLVARYPYIRRDAMYTMRAAALIDIDRVPTI